MRCFIQISCFSQRKSGSERYSWATQPSSASMTDSPHLSLKIKNFSLVRQDLILQTIYPSCKFFCSFQKTLTSQKTMPKCLKRGCIKYKVKRTSRCPCSDSVYAGRLRGWDVSWSRVGGVGTEQQMRRSTKHSERRKKKKKTSLSTWKESRRRSRHVIVCWVANRALGKAHIQTPLIGSESNDHMASIQHDLNKRI